PKGAQDFLPAVLPKTKPGSVVHLYDFCHEEKLQERKEAILQKITQLGYDANISTIKAGQYAPREYRYCHDLTLL
ncbi:MAG: hypothetical protein QW594_03410, partial [Candidatus Woesearchaeota archaeon]